MRTSEFVSFNFEPRETLKKAAYDTVNSIVARAPSNSFVSIRINEVGTEFQGIVYLSSSELTFELTASSKSPSDLLRQLCEDAKTKIKIWMTGRTF